MNCDQCNTENPNSAKFCRSCGAVLGSLCARCGTVALPEDRYCTSCGSDLVEQSGGELMGSSHTQLSITSQYSPQEIDELLALRKTMKRETDSAKTLSQGDVDKLFE